MAEKQKDAISKPSRTRKVHTVTNFINIMNTLISGSQLFRLYVVNPLVSSELQFSFSVLKILGFNLALLWASKSFSRSMMYQIKEQNQCWRNKSKLTRLHHSWRLSFIMWPYRQTQNEITESFQSNKTTRYKYIKINEWALCLTVENQEVLTLHPCKPEEC